jgi:hypothetical protein
MGVAQLVGREASAHTGLGGETAKLASNGSA